jgi:hypothetical protein
MDNLENCEVADGVPMGTSFLDETGHLLSEGAASSSATLGGTEAP